MAQESKVFFVQIRDGFKIETTAQRNLDEVSCNQWCQSTQIKKRVSDRVDSVASLLNNS